MANVKIKNFFLTLLLLLILITHLYYFFNRADGFAVDFIDRNDPRGYRTYY